MVNNDIYNDPDIQNKLRNMNRKDRRKWFKNHHMPVGQRPWKVMQVPSNDPMKSYKAIVSTGDWNRNEEE